MGDLLNDVHRLTLTVKDEKKLKELLEYLMNDDCVITISSDDKILKPEPVTVLSNEESKPNKFRTEMLSLLLIKMCFVPNHNGFHYILSSIEYCVTNKDVQLCITKDIYPYVAKKFNSTVNRVERCIRKSIDYAWYNNGREYLNKIAGFNLSKKLTNSQFISLISEYVKTNRKEFFE